MALTKIGTDGIKDDAVTTDKVANAINTSIAANTAKTSLEDESVTLAKIEHGTSSNDGKFLRANNGADPTFETISIPAGTTINNNANNRVITGSGTANTLEGESSLTYDGNGIFNITGTGAAGVFVITPDTVDGGIYFNNGSSNKGALTYLHTDETMNFRVNGSNKMTINSSGNLVLNSGSGIDFSATSGSGTSELLDDYEEGTFSPQFNSGFSYANTITYQHQVGHYAKIGNQVFAYIYLQPNGNSAHSGNLMTDGNEVQVGGLPFTNNNTEAHEGGGYITYMNGSFGTGGVEIHAKPWVARNQSYVTFTTPDNGSSVIGTETNLTNKYLIFHVRYHV